MVFLAVSMTLYPSESPLLGALHIIAARDSADVEIVALDGTAEVLLSTSWAAGLVALDLLARRADAGGEKNGDLGELHVDDDVSVELLVSWELLGALARRLVQGTGDTHDQKIYLQ